MAIMCRHFTFRKSLLLLILGICFSQSMGHRGRTAHRLRRQAIKEGRCPPWTVLRNCSATDQCRWDGDCFGNQKCCKSTCETRSCYEPNLVIGPQEDACPKDGAVKMSHRENSNCHPVRTRFCFKANCKRCCFHYNTCNPHSGLLISKDECREVLCSATLCDFPGEICIVDKFNSPRCSCRSRCPVPLSGDNVCGTDGIPYKSACELNKTACILGVRDIKIHSFGNCRPNDARVKVSAGHKKKQILPLYRQGELSCRFEGDPVSITWGKVGLRTLPDRMVPRMDKLDILNVDMSDSGLYKCMAYDGYSKAQAEINVTVNRPYSVREVNVRLKDCLKLQSPGYCKRYVVRWYFDGENGVCRTFAYGGCGGNKNNFPTQEACSSACGSAAVDICNFPMIKGPCRGFIPQWFYNSNTSRCEQFTYGGCGGNANRFTTKTQCQERCTGGPSKNSPCLRQQLVAKSSGNRGVFIPNCLSDGRYDEVQCHGSVCFCVDGRGNEITGTRVFRQHRLNCSKAVRNLTNSFTACQMAQKNSSGYPFGSSHLIRCKQDGSYEVVQCSGSTGYCWCVDKDGTKLRGTQTRVVLRCPILGGRLTLCQRQYLERSRNPRLNLRIPQCQQDGAFERIQCQGNRCFCVDPTSGETAKDTSLNTHFGEPMCGDEGHGLTLCQQMHQKAIANSSEDTYVPQCKRNGSFEEIQCNAPDDECWCVDQEGRELPGTRGNRTFSCFVSGNPLTDCQREYQINLRKLPQSINRYVPKCATDGSYEQIQCAGGVCYCVTPRGRRIPGTRTFNFARQPNCAQSDANVTPCERKRQEAILSSRRFVPFCKPDGNWSEIQCERSSKMCWCVDTTGQAVTGTKSSNLKECPDFDCYQFSGTLSPCRKRLLELLKSDNLNRHIPWCKEDGSYNPMQCDGSYCYCVYENGVEQPGTKISVTIGRPECTYSSGKVTDCQRRNQKVLFQSKQNAFVPCCKSDGRYEEVQCQSSSGECWCVDLEGREIPTTRTTKDLKCPLSVDHLTSCQRMYLQFAKKPQMGKMIPRCRKDGTFEPMQCKGHDCFCVDRKGMSIRGTSLPTRLGKPKCGITDNDALTLCQKQHLKALESPATPEDFIPACKRDGRFEEIQCLPARHECWCVDELGREANGTRTTTSLKCPSNASKLTQCQREYQEILRSWIIPGPYIPQCTDDGRYEPIQCQGQYCYCVNEHGVELVRTRVHTTEGRPKCRNRGLLLTMCQEQFQDYLRHPTPGRFEPRCSSTGAFQEVQCHENTCFCVNREGSEKPNTRKIISMGKPACPSLGNSLTECQKMLQAAIHLPPDSKRVLPHCKLNGNYEEIQCHSYSGLCWCVDKDGREVSSSTTNRTVDCPFIETNSLCWTRYQTNVRRGTGDTHIPWCTKKGGFFPLQIQGSQFFCVNDRGYELAGTSVDIKQGKPDCRAANSRGYIATPCQRERARHSYHRLVAGKYVPRCKIDGTYDEVQCDVILGQCWCVNEEGTENIGTRTDGIIRCPNKGNLTACQKSQQRAKELSASGPDPWIFVPRCEEDGSYYQVQCYASTGQCWCVDKNGNELSGTRARGQPDCSENVTTCQYHRIRALGLAESPPLGTFVPHCNPNGSYSDVQCHDFTGLCWCVDEEGHEILGTRRWGQPQCSRHGRDLDTVLDLGILIDASDASVTNWTTILKFLSSVVGYFNISASGTHVGLLVFSLEAEIRLYFNTLHGTNMTVENVKNAVSTLLPKGGPSRFDRALLLAEQELFNEGTGMRDEVPKTLLLVTHGKQARNQGPYTSLLAATQRLRDRGISMYAIGVGDRVEVPELMDLTSSYKNVFLVDDFGDFQSSGRILTEIIKNETSMDVTKARLCNLPPEPGQLGCLDSTLAFYYEASLGECQSFIYNGCGGNANNFPSYEKCMDHCNGALPSCFDDEKRLSVSLPMGHFSPRCKTNGRYKDIQCFKKTGYCWCVDEFGEEIPGTRIMGIPICGLVTAAEKLTTCLEDRRKALGMEGVPSVGRFVPECNPDGEFAEIQCFSNSNFCWCSDNQGYEIAGTHRWGKPECLIEVRPGVCPFVSNATKCHSQQTCSQDSDCPESSKCCDCGCVRRCTLVSKDKAAPVSNCLSEHVKSLSSSCPHLKAPGRFFPTCKPNGEYEERQCNDHYGVCWCVDKEGNEVPGSRQNGKPDCVKQVAMTTCERERKRAITMSSRSVVGMFVASCQPDGSFEQTQCHNATGFCWCVDDLGNELMGTRQWGKPNCTRVGIISSVCQSRRDECLKNTSPKHFIPLCKADGSFEERQCLHSTRQCWCVDKTGNELPGTRSMEMHDCSLLAWLSPCQIKRRQALGLRNVPVVGLHAPECRGDGGYDTLQCHATSGYCWCMDEYGNEVPESRMKGRPNCANKSPCNEETEDILSSFQYPPPGMFIPQCREDGGYQPSQCHDSNGYCWCVDEYGNELIDTRVRGHRNCSGLTDRHMSLCHSDYNKASVVNERGHNIPQCNSDGSYKQVQCNLASRECWCVDKKGDEILETKVNGMPNCQLTEDKANCELFPDSGPCTANMPSWFFNGTIGACEVFIYGGCDGNSNRFPSYYDCQDNCHGRNLTLCELQRAINNARSKDFIPDCKDDGEFEEVQCQLNTGECWCVNKAGIEIPDSRTPGLPHCHETIEQIGSRGAT
ncbi:uncharacterized protein [Montipora foliosa]|uniref:uncharacterized protein isoform X3 n=1 Tax=Montipora foliosa TaxID=591990 RepID=UPI0035F1F20B